MDDAVKKGAPIVGIIFLLLGIVKLLQGKPWVVWFIFAVLFGVLRIFASKSAKGPEA